ncbi:MAG: aconitase/3-isopropylmalate dehydratase large subunit family protein [Dehalococcoidales bacterium]|nr:aconitase/3-isopropylmalate dehydratase large subunit family protein [Dehalococcoidales bacterium]
MGKTIAEKILSRACGREVTPGEIVYPDPDLVVLSDYQIIEDGVSLSQKLKKLGLNKAVRPEKLMVSLDHSVPVTTPLKAEVNKRLKETVAELGVKYFFDEGNHGIEHYMPIEKGLARPGMLVFGGDTHMSNVGSVGALGIPVPYELLTLVATGTLWVKVPKTIKVELRGRLQKGVVGRDVILWIISDIGGERGNYRVLEFTGPGIKGIGIDGRTTICNVSVQIGAKSGIVEPDEVTIEYVKSRTKEPFEVVKSDPDADYDQVFRYDLAKLEPMVALPPTPDNVKPVSAVAGTKIHQANIGSCANGGLDDLRIAAQVVKGRKVHPGVRMVVSAATQGIFIDAVREGIIETLLTAGAIVGEPTCGICGGSIGSVAAGLTCIATSTRNDPGRLGSPETDIYLASPATAAASAIRGEITDPRELL